MDVCAARQLGGKSGFQLRRGGGVNRASPNCRAGGASGKGAHLTGPLISNYELWRRRCPTVFLALKMVGKLSPNTWQMMIFLNSFDALIPKIPFSILAEFWVRITSGAQGSVSVGFCGARQLSPFFCWGGGGARGRARGLYRPTLGPPEVESPFIPPMHRLQVCYVLVAALAAWGFWFYQPFYQTLINGTVVGCLGVGAGASVLAFLMLVIPSPSVTDLLGWLFIPVFFVAIPLGMWLNHLRFVPCRPVSSHAFPTSVKFPFADSPEPAEVDEDTLEPPASTALHSLIGLPLYRDTLRDAPESAVLSTGLPQLRGGTHADLGVRFMWRRRDLTPDFAQVRVMSARRGRGRSRFKK